MPCSNRPGDTPRQTRKPITPCLSLNQGERRLQRQRMTRPASVSSCPARACAETAQLLSKPDTSPLISRYFDYVSYVDAPYVLVDAVGGRRLTYSGAGSPLREHPRRAFKPAKTTGTISAPACPLSRELSRSPASNELRTDGPRGSTKTSSSCTSVPHVKHRAGNRLCVNRRPHPKRRGVPCPRRTPLSGACMTLA